MIQKNYYASVRKKTLNAKMKCDSQFATSPIFVDDKDYEFSVDPELINLVESDPFHGYETETILSHLTKLNDIATYLLMMRRFTFTISSNYFRSH